MMACWQRQLPRAHRRSQVRTRLRRLPSGSSEVTASRVTPSFRTVDRACAPRAEHAHENRGADASGVMHPKENRVYMTSASGHVPMTAASSFRDDLDATAPTPPSRMARHRARIGRRRRRCAPSPAAAIRRPRRAARSVMSPLSPRPPWSSCQRFARHAIIATRQWRYRKSSPAARGSRGVVDSSAAEGQVPPTECHTIRIRRPPSGRRTHTVAVVSPPDVRVGVGRWT
jgi:hypothetical protein